MGNFKRLKNADDRRAEILTAAVKLAGKHGYQNIKRDAIADAANCSTGLVTHHFGTMGQLRRALMRYAITNKIFPVIAQGLAAGDTHAKKAPEEIKREALATLA